MTTSRWISVMLALYPRNFRTEYGDDMRQVYVDMTADHRPLHLGIRLVRDLLISVPQAHAYELLSERKLVTANGLMSAGVSVGKWTEVSFGVLALLLLPILSMTEEIFIPAPYIDTAYTAEFSWEKWNQIQPGMTRQAVHSMLGAPMDFFDGMGGYYGLKSGQEYPDSRCEVYSQDNGKWAFWDFAWISLNVCFDEEGTVKGKNELVMYN